MSEDVTIAMTPGEELDQSKDNQTSVASGFNQKGHLLLDHCDNSPVNSNNLGLITSETAESNHEFNQSVNGNPENSIEKEDWYNQVKNIQIDTLQLQRKLSAELKSEDLNNLSTLKPSPLLNFTSTTALTPKTKAERHVLELKRQLQNLNIEDHFDTNVTARNHPIREELKLKIKAAQNKQKSTKEMELADQNEATSPKTKIPSRPWKPPAPQPPQKVPQAQANAPKQTDQTASSAIFKSNTLGAQLKKMQNSKSAKLVTDSLSLRKNFRGIRKVFKSGDGTAVVSPTETARRFSQSVENIRYSANDDFALLPLSVEREVTDDFSSPTKETFTPDYDGARRNSRFAPEISKILSIMNETDSDSDAEDESKSSDSENEESVISEDALYEIEAFEKLISDYQEVSQRTSSSEDISAS